MSFTRMEDPTPQDLNDSLVSVIKADIADAQSYHDSVIDPAVKRRYEIYYADKDYYTRKFPQLSKYSSIVSTDVTDTIEWALPSLIKVFTGGDEVVTVQGVSEEDDKNAEIMQKLLVYQLQRQNRFFPVLYNWMKDALITGMGIVKCYWERKEDVQVLEQTMNYRALQDLQQQKVQILSVSDPDEYGLFVVQYSTPYYVKNSPVIENVLSSELLYSSDAKTLEDANFVAHKKKVTLSYLRERQQQGVYANVDKITVKNSANANIFGNDDQVEDVIGDKYQRFTPEQEEARTEVYLYECYTKLDWNGDGILEDLIVTIVDDTVLRVEQNYMGRHPFFDISPTRDPHRIWTKRSYADLIGELQDLKVALTRQIVHNIALTNDPKMILSEDAINIDDFIKGRAVIRKKANHSMSDVAMSMPVNQLSPYSYQMLEYIETQKENRTGITRYNQGLDSRSLNKMLALDTPIPLADGTYKKNEDIVEGDMVIGSDGKPTRVLKAHPIQMPKRAFKVTFETGDVIKAGGEHRWSVKVADKHSGHKSPDWEKLPTERIFDLMQTGHKVWVPRVKEPDFTEKDLPVDPYVFGAWLGDGNSHTNRFTSMDSEVVEAFDKWSKQFYKGHIEPCKQQNSGKATTYSIVNTPFRKMLKNLGVLKDSRYEECANNVKHIPDIYLQGSFEQRLALLRGLMDTDGCITRDGQAIFCNSEPALVETFIKLVHSFGLRATACWNKGVAKQFPNARPHAHVTFSAPFCPVTIAHKVERWKTKEPIRWEQQRIVSIEEIEVEPMRCLTVAAEDELYCCGHIMTLTSNTASGIQAILGQSTQRLELIARMFAETGIYEMLRFLIGLNQKFIDQDTVIRLTNTQLSISPDDLQGNFDLVVNAGISIATKESTQMMLQQILTALMQTNAAGMQVVTPENIYNLFKKWIEAAGFKNYADYITDPSIIQQRTILETQMKQQVLATLPPEVMQTYMSTGVIPPEYLLQLPPSIQALFGGITDRQNGFAVQTTAPNGYGQSGTSQIGLSSDTGVVGGLSRGDNRVPQNVPREQGNGVPQSVGGVGGF